MGTVVAVHKPEAQARHWDCADVKRICHSTRKEEERTGAKTGRQAEGILTQRHGGTGQVRQNHGWQSDKKPYDFAIHHFAIPSYVHQERLNVRSVGEVRLVFSTAKAQLAKATPDDVKILMTNSLKFSAREIAELYSLRWQIELFFKELKSTLGFHQYQFRDFQCVGNWCELTLTTFLFLEDLRARQLARRGLSEKDKKWWRHQRTHGLCQAVRLASQQNELTYLAERLETPGGIQKLKLLLRASFASEYRVAL